MRAVTGHINVARSIFDHPMFDDGRPLSPRVTWQNEPKDRRQFIPYPASWLNAGGYEDEPECDGKPAPSPIDPQSFDDEGWRKRLIHFRDANQWLREWGPKPGEPGCLVPSHLIVTPVSTATGAA